MILYSMSKQNYISALAILSMSIICLIVGYWIGEKERRNLKKDYLEYLSSNAKYDAMKTKTNIEMLYALKEGNVDLVANYLKALVGSGIKEFPPVGHPDNENLMTSLKNTRALVMKYQNEHCSDSCLGL